MVAETRYVDGDGVLLGSGDQWLLMTDPGDDEIVERLWTALAGGPDPAATVLDLVQAAFGGDPPGLVLVDLTPGTGRTVSLGTGRVRVEGPARLVSIDGSGHDPARRPLRRLLGGVVGARSAEIRPLTPRVAAAPAGRAPGQVVTVPAPPAPPTGLIDGIPRAILEARGPDGPPAPRVRRPAPSAADSGPRETREPDPLSTDRVEAPAAEVTASTPEGRPDHDESTVFRSAASEHLTSTTGETVQAVWCPDEHPTPPDVPLCRVCRRQVAPQTAQRVARPTLGGLRLPTGEVVPLDRGVVLGRRPAPVPGAGDWPHLVHLPAEHTYVSRMHVQIGLEGWLVVARDLGSRGGTTWKVPGRPPEPMVAGEPYVLEPGHAVDLADVYEVRYDVGPEAAL